MNNRYRIINFDEFGDKDGKLVAIENGKNIPFNINILYLWDKKWSTKRATCK